MVNNIPCNFDLAGSRTDLRNRNVYNLNLDRTMLSGTTWYCLNFGGNYVQFKLFSSRHKSNILVALDDPGNEQIEIFDGLEINRTFGRLYFKYISNNERNDTPIQLLIGDFKEQIRNVTPLNGYVVYNSGALGTGGGNVNLNYYPNSKKVRILFYTSVAIGNLNYDIIVQTYSPVTGANRASFYQTELASERLLFEIDISLNERLNITLTNNHGATALTYFVEVESF